MIEFPFPGSLTSTFLGPDDSHFQVLAAGVRHSGRVVGDTAPCGLARQSVRPTLYPNPPTPYTIDPEP